MSNQPFYPNDVLDWDALADESIELALEQIAQAAHLSQSVPNSLQQWQIYLQALALFGFKQWLEEWAPDLEISDARCSIYHPQYANLLDAVCSLQVEEFTLCLITVGSLADAVINIPRAIIDLPQFTPHLYVLLEVQEEQMEVKTYGYLRHDQLADRQQAQPLREHSNWTYEVPLDWFNSGSDALLLDLRYLDINTISLPTVSPQNLILTDEFQERLINRLPQLQSPNCHTKQVIRWDEAAIILTYPELSNWLYQVQQTGSNQELAFSRDTSRVAELRSQLLSTVQNLTQRAVNVGLWLQDQLDNAAQELSWVLMPVFAPATSSALRSSVEVESVISALRSNVEIPDQARGAYRDLRWGGVALRLYALTWIIPPVDGVSEWTLLLVLGTPSGAKMQPGVQLQVQDSIQLLADQVVTENAQDRYLYAQVVGVENEQFWVTIDMANGAVVTLPFTFYSDIAS